MRKFAGIITPCQSNAAAKRFIRSSPAAMIAQNCAPPNIQTISWKTHPPTGWNGRVGFQNEAIRASVRTGVGLIVQD
jgi:hypothetical protein